MASSTAVENMVTQIATRYKLMATRFRKVATQLTVKHVLADGSVLTQYSVPTRFVLNDELGGVSTVFLGIVTRYVPAFAPTTVRQNKAGASEYTKNKLALPA